MTSRSPAATRVEQCQGAASISRSAYTILANEDGIGAAANIGSNYVGADESTRGRGADELPPLTAPRLVRGALGIDSPSPDPSPQSLMTLISLWTRFTWAVARAIDTAFSAACRVLTRPLSHTTPSFSVV